LRANDIRTWNRDAGFLQRQDFAPTDLFHQPRPTRSNTRAYLGGLALEVKCSRIVRAARVRMVCGLAILALGTPHRDAQSACTSCSLNLGGPDEGLLRARLALPACGSPTARATSGRAGAGLSATLRRRR
jgi:hypothetical protein